MKKKIFSVLLLVLCLACVSCAASTNDFAKETDGTNSNESELPPDDSEDIHVMSYSENALPIDVEEIDFLSAEEYIETNVPTEKEYEFLGVKYELEYLNSAQYTASDLCVRVYKVKDAPRGMFHFNAADGSFVKATGIPYNTDNMTESWCLSVIKELVGSRVDLDEMTLKINTTYRKRSDNFIEQNVVPGIYTCTGSNEELMGYYFFYTQEINGMQNEKRVIADFYYGQMLIEIIDIDRSEQMKNIDVSNVEPAVRAYLEKHQEKDCTITSVEINTTGYRQVAGTSYLIVNARVDYKKSAVSVEEEVFEDDEEEYSYSCLITLAVKI